MFVAIPSFAVALLAAACSSTTGTVDDGDGGAQNPSDPAVSAATCGEACKSKANECGAPASAAESQCDSLCGGSPTRSQLDCLADTSCSALARIDSASEFDTACKKGASPTPTATSTSTAPPKDSGPAACVAIGRGGCSSLNAPSGCCTDAAHPAVVCNGNNDGKGNAQCCVNAGKACTDVSDCCGYAGANKETKPYYRCDGTCKFG